MHFSCCSVTCESSDVQLFFHPVNEDLSTGTPDLTEKLREDQFRRPAPTGEMQV